MDTHSRDRVRRPDEVRGERRKTEPPCRHGWGPASTGRWSHCPKRLGVDQCQRSPRPQEPQPRVPGPEDGPPGLFPTTWSTRAWLSSPTGCRNSRCHWRGGAGWPLPASPDCPAWRSPRLGGSGWAVSVPTGRTALRVWPPWGTGAQAASGSPGHAPAGSDTGGPGGGASRVSPKQGEGSFDQCDLDPYQQNLCGRHLLPPFLAQHPEFLFGNLPSPPHGMCTGT